MRTHGCTNTGLQVTRAIKFCSLVPSICGFFVWNFLHVTVWCGFQISEKFIDVPFAYPVVDIPVLCLPAASTCFILAGGQLVSMILHHQYHYHRHHHQYRHHHHHIIISIITRIIVVIGVCSLLVFYCVFWCLLLFWSRWTALKCMVSGELNETNMKTVYICDGVALYMFSNFSEESVVFLFKLQQVSPSRLFAIVCWWRRSAAGVAALRLAQVACACNCAIWKAVSVSHKDFLRSPSPWLWGN
jgi:hypothetical protein